MKLLHNLLLTILLIAPAVSASAVKNIEDVQITQELSVEQVKKAIVFAGSGRGWTMHEEQPGVIKAILDVRTHQAVVQIDYTTKQYSIVYVDSTNLVSKKGKMHKNYYRWINNLKSDIDKLLFQYSYSG